MTFTELENKFGKLNPADWHQHPNGGAWIYKNAKVSEKVPIGEKAVVWDGTIWGGTIWDGTIRGGTIWGGTIWDGTIRGGTIRGGTWKTTPLFICGSRFKLTNSKPGHISIGCECHPFAWWEGKAAKELAKKHDFTPAEIKEYRAYIKLFKAIGK
jgi:hypothetical protein